MLFKTSTAGWSHRPAAPPAALCQELLIDGLRGR